MRNGHYYFLCVILGVYALSNPSRTYGQECRIEKKGNQIILENSFVKVVVHPDLGGTITSFIHKKTGVDYTSGPQGSIWPGQGAGLLVDRFWGDKQIRGENYERAVYSYKIIKEAREEIILSLWHKPSSGPARDILVEKNLHLSRDNSALSVRYRVINKKISKGAGEADSFISRQWQTQVLRPGGAKAKECIFYYPSRDEIKEVSYNPSQTTAKNVHITEPSRGWAAVVDKNRSCGAAIRMDYPHLDLLYSFLPSATGNNDYPTLEWRHNLFKWSPRTTLEGYEPAELKTELQIIPFCGLEKVSDVGKSVVMSMKKKEDRLLGVKIYSSEKTEIRFVLKEVSPDGDERILKERKITTLPDVLESFDIPVAGSLEENNLLYGQLWKRDKLVAQAELPSGKDYPKGYQMASLEKKIKPYQRSVHFTEEVITPHIKWAKPLSSGTMKTLFIGRNLRVREVLELAQRLEMDYEIVPVGHIHVVNKPHWLLKADPNERLKKSLTENWDVIVIGGVVWNQFSDENRKKLIETVRKGVGLVYIHPRRLDKEILGKREMKNLTYPFQLIPLDTLPVLKDIRQNDLLETYSLGRGKIILVNYPLSYAGKQYATNFLLPASLHYNRKKKLWTKITWRGEYQNVEVPEVADFDFWEYYYAFLCKLFLTATDREPQVKITSLKISKSIPTHKKDTPPSISEFLGLSKMQEIRIGESVELDLELSGDIRHLAHPEATIIIKDSKGNHLYKKTLALSKEQLSSKKNIQLPPVNRAGKTFLDFVLTDERKVIDFGSIYFSVCSPARIVDLKVEKEVLEKGEKVRGEVIIRHSDTGKLEVDIRLQDGLGRVLDSFNSDVQSPPSEHTKQHTIPFELSTSRTKTNLTCLTAELKQGDKICGSSRKTIYLDKELHYDDVKFGIWVGGPVCPMPTEYSYRLNKLKELGMDVLHSPFWNSVVVDMIAKEGFEIAPEHVSQIQAQGRAREFTEESLIRNPCLTDPLFLQERKQVVEDAARNFKQYWVGDYSLGDEDSLGALNPYVMTKVCFSPTCLKNLRKYLRNEYGSLKELNKWWETSFASWDEVKPFTFSESKDKGNFSSWVDHRLFMDSVWTKFTNLSVETVKSIDQTARVGLGGTRDQGVGTGFDWYQLMKVMNHVVYYPLGEVREFVRSFKGEGAIGGAWSIRNPWLDILHGMNIHYYWWEWYLLNSDLTVHHRGDWVKKYHEELAKGVGKALVNAEFIDDGIAIHFSQPSMYGSVVTGVYTKINLATYKQNQSAWARLIEDLGLQYVYLSREQIEEGKLIPSRFKVFILPLSQCISKEETSRIEDFVKRGGVLIADARAGIMDSHGKKYAVPPLDRLFGTKHRNLDVAGQGTIDVSSFLGKQEILSLPPIDADLALTEGKSVAFSSGDTETRDISFGTFRISQKETQKRKIPCIITNDCAKGKAVYLNFLMAGYDGARVRRLGENIQQTMRKILEENGIRPKVQISTVTGTSVSGIESFFFRRGEIDYLGLIRNLDTANTKERTVRIMLRERRHIYDMRRQKYLGCVSEFQAELDPLTYGIVDTLPPGELEEGSAAKLYAFLPYRVKKISLSADRRTYADDGIKYSGRVEVSTGKCGDHVVNIEVLGESGKIHEEYSTNILTDNGKFQGKIDLALNDPPGKWKIIVEDVISGNKATEEVEVRTDREF